MQSYNHPHNMLLPRHDRDIPMIACCNGWLATRDRVTITHVAEYIDMSTPTYHRCVRSSRHRNLSISHSFKILRCKSAQCYSFVQAVPNSMSMPYRDFLQNFVPIFFSQFAGILSSSTFRVWCDGVSTDSRITVQASKFDKSDKQFSA